MDETNEINSQTYEGSIEVTELYIVLYSTLSILFTDCRDFKLESNQFLSVVRQSCIHTVLFFILIHLCKHTYT